MKLEDLRLTAAKSRDAVYASDLAALGRAMIENTEAQARLHPDLVSAEGHQVIELAQAHGALGCKVNGAGGDGGSLTLLVEAESDQKRALVSALEVANPLFQPIPIYLSRFGLRVWNSP